MAYAFQSHLGYGSNCLDGSDGLTRELYEAGDPSKYANVTCIPAHAFQEYNGDVTLDKGLAFLTSIGNSAFDYYFSGTLTIKGSFPLLATIGQAAFDNAGNADSVIELVDGLPALTSIGSSAFDSFRGMLTIKGSFPLLATIGQEAFRDAGNANSAILLNGVKLTLEIGSNAFADFRGHHLRYACPDGSDGFTQEVYEAGNPIKYANVTCIPAYAFQDYDGAVELDKGLAFLTSIGEQAFDSFPGRLTIKGSFPLLATIGQEAFGIAGNADSVTELVDGLPALTSIGSSAFDSFNGTVSLPPGPFPKFIGCTRLTGAAQHVILAAPNQNPLTRELYEAGDPSKYADVTCIPVYEFQEYNGDVTLDKGLAFLTSIGSYAFVSFRGTLTIKGSFPLLATIGQAAFYGAGNAYSVIELDGGLPALTSIGSSAFDSFSGR
eukprot:gene21993-biopygen13442